MKIMSWLGIVLAAIGILFGLAAMISGGSDSEKGFGFISLALFGYFLAFSITAVVTSKLKNISQEVK